MDMTTSRTVMVQIPAKDYQFLRSFARHMGWKMQLKKEHPSDNYAQSVSPSEDEWWNTPDNVAMVQEGDRQLQQGQGVELTTDDIRTRLGL